MYGEKNSCFHELLIYDVNLLYDELNTCASSYILYYVTITVKYPYDEKTQKLQKLLSKTFELHKLWSFLVYIQQLPSMRRLNNHFYKR